MKRLQIMIDDDLDDLVHSMAIKEKTSKAAIIRRLVRQGVTPLPPLEEDPIWQMAGVDDYEPVEDIDEFLYG